MNNFSHDQNLYFTKDLNFHSDSPIKSPIAKRLKLVLTSIKEYDSCTNVETSDVHFDTDSFDETAAWGLDVFSADFSEFESVEPSLT